MPLTFDTALAKIKTTDVMEDYWENWNFYDDNRNNLTAGMLPLFLCDRHKEIKKEIGESTFYALLREMAEFAKKLDPDSLVVTPNAKPDQRPKSPLWKAIIVFDSKAVKILLDYTPQEGINRKVCSRELPAHNMVINYMLSNALFCGIDKAVIYKLLSKITNIEALDEALQQTNGKQQGYNGMRGYGDEGIAEIHGIIKKRRAAVLNPEAEKGWGASIVSIFWGTKKKDPSAVEASARPKGVSVGL